MIDPIKDKREEDLYKLLGKTLNDFIDKTPLPPQRLLRVLANMSIQLINNCERDR